MSYASNDIQGGGSGGNAEPSMEEILASIRRILKEDEPGKQAAPGAGLPEAPPPPQAAKPVPSVIPLPEPPPAQYAAPPGGFEDDDDDVLLLDASMIARPADYASATALPPVGLPSAAPPAPQAGPEPLHFSSEPAPFSRDFELGPRAMPEPVVELPPADEFEPEPLPPSGYTAPPFAASHYTAPPEPAPPPEILAEPEPAAYRPLQPPYMPPLPDPVEPPAAPAPAAFWQMPEPPPQAAYQPEPEPEPEPEPFPAARFAPPPVAEPEPYRPAAIPEAAHTAATFPTEPEMNDAPIPGSFELPESLISDKTTDAAASSIGALVRSMTTEKSVAVSKSSSVTIEDIVREEIRPLLKSWLDTHLPTLVERVVRSEIERVINRSVV